MAEATTDGRLHKMEVDCSGEVAVRLPECERLAKVLLSLLLDAQYYLVILIYLSCLFIYFYLFIYLSMVLLIYLKLLSLPYLLIFSYRTETWTMLFESLTNLKRSVVW